MHEPLGTARDDEKIVLSIVLPCFREHANLELLLPSIHEEFRDVSHEVVVVDDGSADGTVELVGKFSTLHGNVRLIERDRRLGIGSALREGYAAARGEFILSSDADLSFSVNDMSRLLREAQQGFDLVLGYKLFYRPMAASSRATEVFARLSFITSEFGNLVVAATTGVFGIRNFNTNFRILRRDLWQRVETREDRNFFLLETIMAARDAEAQISEIPVQFRNRRFGDSKMNFMMEAPRYFYQLLRLVFRRSASRRRAESDTLRRIT